MLSEEDSFAVRVGLLRKFLALFSRMFSMASAPAAQRNGSVLTNELYLKPWRVLRDRRLLDRSFLSRPWTVSFVFSA
jgi:hypothetical protein